MIGQIFGRLTVLEEVQERDKHRYISYVCACSCGNKKIVTGKLLRRGTQSCGCIQKEFISKLKRIDDALTVTKHPLYVRWCGMKARCYSANHHKYPDYGARGIKVCDSWRDSFINFVNDMGECPEGYSLDRINNDGDYTKDNCKWSSPSEQANNRRKRNSGQMYRKITT